MESYVEKLNIVPLSIMKIRDLICKDILLSLKMMEKDKDIEKTSFHIIGPAGIGKTSIVYQIRDKIQSKLKDKKVDLIKIQAPLFSRDDMILPFPSSEKKFKMLYSDFIPTEEDSIGIFLIDEFSRGDHAFQQLMWQIQNEYMIHTKPLPKGWFVISLDNPDDQEYSLDILEDAAGLRRQLHMYVELSVSDFLKYCDEFNVHPLVKDFIEKNPNYLYDFKAQRQGMIYANPASWEKVSNHLWKYGKEINNSLDDLLHLSAGLLNINTAMTFIDFIKSSDGISPKDIWFKYSSIENQIKNMVVKNKHGELSDLMNSFCTFLASSKPEMKENYVKNFGKFLSVVPSDIGALFILNFDSYKKNSPEFKYLFKLSMELSRISNEYRKLFYEKIESLT